MGSERNLISPSTQSIVFTFIFLDYIKDFMIYNNEGYFIHVWFVGAIKD